MRPKPIRMISRAAMTLLTVLIAFAGAQTATATVRTVKYEITNVNTESDDFYQITFTATGDINTTYTVDVPIPYTSTTVSWTLGDLRCEWKSEDNDAYFFVAPNANTIYSTKNEEHWTFTISNDDYCIANVKYYRNEVGVSLRAERGDNSKSCTLRATNRTFSPNDYANSMFHAFTVTYSDTPAYRITYYLNGGTDVGANPEFYEATDGVPELAAPTWEGHTFVGWYDGWQCKAAYAVTGIAAGTTSNKKFYAKWKGVMAGNSSGTMYAVRDEDELKSLRDAVNAGDGKTDIQFIQLADITITGDDWTPIGNNDNKFQGIYDGGNYTISGLKFSNSGDYRGLFGYVSGSGSEVKNLTVTVSSLCKGGSNTGMVVGYMYLATVRNCHVRGGILQGYTSSKANIGGVVGQSYCGKVENCTSTTLVKDGTYSGCIIGKMAKKDDFTATATNCFFYLASSSSDYSTKAVGSKSNTTVTNCERAYMLNTSDGATQPSKVNVSDGFYYNGRGYYQEGIAVAIGHEDRYGYTFNGYTTTAGTLEGSTLTMPASNVTVKATYIAENFTDNGDGTYTIYTTTGWDAFCDALQDNTTYNRFSGKTVLLGADIGTAETPVTRMAGTQSHDFCGTFDGQGYTLTFTSTENVNGVAPFSYVSETTPTGGTEVSHPAIRNLNVVADINTAAQYASALVGRMWGTLTIEGCTVGGTIQTSAMNAAGFIGEQNGTASITDCLSSVTIKSSVEGDGTHGGFVAVKNSISGNTLTIEGCVFNGKLLTTNSTTKCGGFIGWRAGTAEIHNSLFDPATPTGSETWVGNTESATFARNKVDTYNCYYTYLLCDGTHYVPGYVEATETAPAKWYNGKAACPATAAPVGSATHAKYTVSGITPYANGIQRTVGDATTFYYGGGDIVSAPYVDENGDNASHAAITLSPTHMPATLAANYDSNDDGTPDQGWYVVTDNIEYTGTLTLACDVNIILADGKTMSVSGGNKGINADDGSLTIYGQTLGTGTLNATATNGIGINTDGIVTINGGTVNATGTSDGIYAVVTFSGGNLTATGSTFGIRSNVTLSWTSPDDRITVSSFNSERTITIADGKHFHNGSEVLSGTVYNYNDGNPIGDLSKLNGKTLIGVDVLQDAATNDVAALATRLGGKQTNVALSGRTLFKDGDWNTLCLPFDVVVGSGQMAGATAMTMNAAQSGFDSASGLLTLSFDGVGEGSTIAAGTPFIVKWTGNAGQFVENPMFSGVTISGTAAGSISFDGGSFRGTYNVMTFDAADPNVVLLEEGSNTLKYAASGDYLGACRAYFVVDPTAVGEGQTGARPTDYILHLGSLGLLEGSFNQRGDANGDGSISVTDIAVVVNCILQLTNNGGFSEYGADANGDGDITVTDIGVIVDLILGTSGNAASRRLTHDAPEPQ